MSILVSSPSLVGLNPLPLANPRQNLGGLIPIIGGNDNGDRLADHLCGGIAKDGGGGKGGNQSLKLWGRELWIDVNGGHLLQLLQAVAQVVQGYLVGILKL